MPVAVDKRDWGRRPVLRRKPAGVPAEPREATPIQVRDVVTADLPAIIELDRRLTGVAKRDYWQEGIAPQQDRFFLVAQAGGGAFAGFSIGEIRAWEFGSPPAGWIFAIQVDPALRQAGIGTALFDGLCARFRASGIDRVRTMVDRRDHLILSFFRAQGLTAGPSLELEMELPP
ncbi:MAG: GNAT family N-acetyltransferase [Alphaproteobacteria bacterium]|nr:GNAT family N-acetyltransferase [Alphaproteobacteria bacterium]MCW5739180.1 GNAT family N-acetyltransferase [Alphaproteobacteria bacterium]